MSKLKQEALQIIESADDVELLKMIKFMEQQKNRLTREERLAIKQQAYKELQELINRHNVKVSDDFDCKKELAEYREERFGNANFA